MTTRFYTVPKGDRWIQPIVVSIPSQPAFSWVGITARAQFRLPNETLVKTITPTADLSVAGKASFILELTGAETGSQDIGTTIMGDIVLTRTSPVFGPHAPIGFSIKIERRITDQP